MKRSKFSSLFKLLDNSKEFNPYREINLLHFY